MKRKKVYTFDGKISVLDKDLSRLLVGVGSIAKGELLGAGGILLAQVVRDCLVVLRGLVEGLEGEELAGLVRDLVVLLELGNDRGIVLGVREDADTDVVLGSSTEKSDTTYIFDSRDQRVSKRWIATALQI